MRNKHADANDGEQMEERRQRHAVGVAVVLDTNSASVEDIVAARTLNFGNKPDESARNESIDEEELEADTSTAGVNIMDTSKGAVRPGSRTPAKAHLPLKEQVAMVENEGIEDFMVRLCREKTGYDLSPVVELEHQRLEGDSYGGFWYQWAQDWLHGIRYSAFFLSELLEEALTRREDARFVSGFLLNPAKHREDSESVKRLSEWTDPAACGVFYTGKFFDNEGELRSDNELRTLGAELSEYLEEDTRRGVELFGNEFVEFDTDELENTFDFFDAVNDEGGSVPCELEQEVDTWLRKNISKRSRGAAWTVNNELVGSSADDENDDAVLGDENDARKVVPAVLAFGCSTVDMETGAVIGTNIAIVPDEDLPDLATASRASVIEAARAGGAFAFTLLDVEDERS